MRSIGVVDVSGWYRGWLFADLTPASFFVLFFLLGAGVHRPGGVEGVLVPVSGVPQEHGGHAGVLLPDGE